MKQSKDKRIRIYVVEYVDGDENLLNKIVLSALYKHIQNDVSGHQVLISFIL